MPLLALIVVLLIVGIVLAMFPIDPQVKKLIIVLLVIATILVICAGLGVFGGGGWSWRVPVLR